MRTQQDKLLRSLDAFAAHQGLSTLEINLDSDSNYLVHVESPKAINEGPIVITHEQLMAMDKEARYEYLRARVDGTVIIDNRLPSTDRPRFED